VKTVAPNPPLVVPAAAARAAGVLMVLLTSVAALGGCASGGTTNARYPRRPPGCALAVYHTAVPGIAAWDDLGVAEAVCNIGIPVAECLRVLRAEACRMGGDILYNVPRTPFRPRDQVMQFRGQVAHTRHAGAGHAEAPHDGEGGERAKEDELPPPATAEEAAGPVTPLPSAHAPGEAEPTPPEKSSPP
jgi:hypothetical protein